MKARVEASNFPGIKCFQELTITVEETGLSYTIAHCSLLANHKPLTFGNNIVQHTAYLENNLVLSWYTGEKIEENDACSS